MTVSPMHAAARALAEAGIPVIPCEPNGKRPLVMWQTDRSSHLAQIDAWWAQWPDANLAVVPEDFGCMALDLDVKGNGAETWAGLQIEYDTVIGTRVHATPSGGRHILLRGSAPPSVRRLGAGIDVRGRDSYILWPGSVIDGKPYYAIDASDPAPMPDWLTALTARPARAERERVDGLEWDTPRALADAYDYIDRCIRNGDVPEPGNRNDHAFRWMAHVVKGLAISGERAKALYSDFLDRSGGTAPDGWPNDAKVDDIIYRLEAEMAGDNPPGSERTKLASELYDPAIRAALDEDDGGPRTLNGTDLDDTDLGPDVFEPCADPPIVESEHPELCPGWIERGIFTYHEGAGGIGKSYIAQQDAACLAAGRSMYGVNVEQCDVLYLNYEEPRDEWIRRLHRIRTAFGSETKVPGAPASPKPLDTQRLTAVHLREKVGAHLLRVDRRGTIIITRFGRRLRDYLARARDHGGHTYLVLDGLIDAILFEGSTRSEDDVARQVIALLDRWCVELDITGTGILHPSQAGARAGGDSYAPAWATKPRARQSYRRCGPGGKTLSTTDYTPIQQIFTRRTVTKRSHGVDGGFVDLQYQGGIWQPLIKTTTGGEPEDEVALRIALTYAAAHTKIKRNGSQGYIGSTHIGERSPVIQEFRRHTCTQSNVEHFLSILDKLVEEGRLQYLQAPSGSNGEPAGYCAPAT